MAKPSPVRNIAAITPMPEAARTFLTARLGDVQRHLSKLGEEMAPDDVHDARVATRRLRAALKLFGDRRQVKKADRVVSALQDALGEVRDLHVQLDAFTKLGRKAPPAQRTVLKRLRDGMASGLPGRVSRLGEAKTEWDKDGLQALSRLEQLTPPGRLGGHRMRGALVGQLEELEARIIRALEDPTARPMHKLRIAVKRFRYSMELLEPAMPEEIAQLYGELVPLQQGLGDLHDTDVRIGLVDSRSDASNPGADGLLRRLRTERDRQAQEVLRALGTWEDEAMALRGQVLLSGSPVKRGAGPPARGRQ